MDYYIRSKRAFFKLFTNGENTFGLKLNTAASFSVLQLKLNFRNVFRLNMNRKTVWKLWWIMQRKWKLREKLEHIKGGLVIIQKISWFIVQTMTPRW